MKSDRTDNPKGLTARILVVDDDPDGANSLAMLLRIYGHDSEAITDSSKCLTSLESFRPNVVLLDIVMPQPNGYEVAKQIRKLPDSDKIAVIAVSGYADSPHIQKSFESGCDQHLVKPVEIRTLEATIATELSKRLLATTEDHHNQLDSIA